MKTLFISLASTLCLLSGCGNKPSADTTPETEKVVWEDTSSPTTITNRDQFEKAIHSEDLVLVDFHATWCGPCQKMHPIMERLCKENHENLRIVKVDIDENEDIADEYQIQAVPTLLLFKGGKLAWSQLGSMELEELQTIIKQHL